MTQLKAASQQLTESIANGSDFSRSALDEQFQLPEAISNVFFQLGKHYYMKKAKATTIMKYLQMDLVVCPDRHESWLILALIYSNIVENAHEMSHKPMQVQTFFTFKLNAILSFSLRFIVHRLSDLTTKILSARTCFRKCLELQEQNEQVLILLGFYLYNVHSNFHILSKEKEL